MKSQLYNPGTRGGPGGRDRMLAVKSLKIARKSVFLRKYWGKQIFAHGRFPEVGEKQKTEGKKRRERLNNGQATHGACKHAWRTQAAWANNGENNGQATHGARKHAWRTQAAWANCQYV